MSGRSGTETGARFPRRLAAPAAALGVTVVLGAWLRLALAGRATLVGDFSNLLHAHSHLGYFGVLFPLAWAGWKGAGAPVPGARWMAVYAVATVLSFVGFLRAGYGPEAIAGSTLVGLIWLGSAWGIRDRVLRPDDPLALVPPGVVGAMACVPFIALNLRSNPPLAQGLIATFLAVLLLAVIAPSALAARGIRAVASPVLAACALLGALSLGIWPSAPARAGLALYAAWLVSVGREGSLPLHLRGAWALVGAGLLAMAAGLLPNVRPVVIGAIHFMVLSPLLGTLARGWLPRSLPEPAWWVLHLLVVLLAGPLVMQGLGGGVWTLTASAAGGVGVALWWGWALAMQGRQS